MCSWIPLEDPSCFWQSLNIFFYETHLSGIMFSFLPWWLQAHSQRPESVYQYSVLTESVLRLASHCRLECTFTAMWCKFRFFRKDNWVSLHVMSNTMQQIGSVTAPKHHIHVFVFFKENILDNDPHSNK